MHKSHDKQNVCGGQVYSVDVLFLQLIIPFVALLVVTKHFSG